MAKGRTKVLPLIPIAPPLAVLPGTSLTIPITNRSDVAAILAKIYSLGVPKADASITVACVPLNSPAVSPVDGNLLIEGSNNPDTSTGYLADPVQAGKRDIFGYACVARVSGMQGRRQGDLSLVVDGLVRVQVVNVVRERPYFEAELAEIEEFVDVADEALEAQFAQLKQLARELLALVRLSAILPRATARSLSPVVARRLELYIARKEVDEAGALADFMANVVECTHVEKLRILAAVDPRERVERVIEVLQRQISAIQGETRAAVTSPPKQVASFDIDTFRRLQNDSVAKRGKQEEEPSDVDELKARLQKAQLTPEADKVAQRELARLQKINPAQAEYQVCRNYLDTLADIPWTVTTPAELDANTLTRARAQLDDDHYGLDTIKKRLLEYLAVLKLKAEANRSIDEEMRALTDPADEHHHETGDSPARQPSSTELQLLQKKRMVDKSPILLFVGPPGTGKTSLAKSVATALGRKFHRISLGGVRDEAEIRGHRRTYVAAMPGVVVGGLRKVGVANPVFLLDEIDKLSGANHNGDPSAAMLEVLDPEQNHAFTDHYLNIPVDLSKVLFIATANSLDTIPAPLLDRMETIQLSGYTTLEKRHIANRHLIPKQVTSNGLRKDNISIPGDVLDKIITSYTREAGVRNLEREIGAVCRGKAVEYATAKDSNTLATYSPTVTLDDLDAALGIERFTEEISDPHTRPGVITGLVAYSTGSQGSILFIEIASMPGTGGIKLTGTLGSVLKESVEVALSWVKTHAYSLHLTASPTADIMSNRSLHVHCPSGATPKDGPSAGLAHTLALISLFADTPVPAGLAVTGEMSLRGRILPVGGIREKLIGALQAGIERVILPEANRKDVRECPDEVKDGIKICFVRGIWEAVELVWPGRWEGVGERGESRL